MFEDTGVTQCLAYSQVRRDCDSGGCLMESECLFSPYESLA